MPIIEFPDDAYTLKPSRSVRDVTVTRTDSLSGSTQVDLDFKVNAPHGVLVEISKPQNPAPSIDLLLFGRLEPDDPDPTGIHAATDSEHWVRYPSVAPLGGGTGAGRSRLARRSRRLFRITDPVDWIRLEVQGSGGAAADQVYTVTVRVY